MINIRSCVFETNSSSTHSINICTRKDWLNWKEGKLLYNPYEEHFIDNYLLSEEKKMARLREYYESMIKKEFYKEFQDLTKEEVRNLMMRAVSDGYIFDSNADVDCYDYFTYSDFWDTDDELEHYVTNYTSESGEEIVIFGKYG